MSKRHKFGELFVYLSSEQIGKLFFNNKGQFSFAYNNSAGNILSVTMSDMNRTYSGTLVENWFRGVLPDDEGTRRAMARNKDYGPNSVFGLLSDFGADLPGAIQVFSPDNMSEIERESEYLKINADAIASRLNEMICESNKRLNVAWHAGMNTGHLLVVSQSLR